MKLITIVLSQAVLIALLVSFVAAKCEHSRDYGRGSVVCVCSEELKCTQGDLAHAQINADRNIVTSFRSTKAGDRFTRHEYSLTKQSVQSSNASLKIQVNPTKKYQKIIGFGGAFTDSTGHNIAQLPKPLQDRLMRDYFGEDGLGYRVARIPVGGTDFSARPYSLDDHADDDKLEKFALQEEDYKNKLPFIHQANQLSNDSIRYFASAWSPPAWMKTNAELHHGGYLKGNPGEKYYQLYAKYLIRFLEEYQKQNVSLWGMTIVNEPTVGNTDYTWNVLQLNSTQQRDFIGQDLGPLLNVSKFSHLNLMIYDDSVTLMEEYVSTVLSDPEVAKYVSGIAFHWYMNLFTSQAPVLDNVADKFPDKFILSTEACSIFGDADGHHVLLGAWLLLEAYARDIIIDLNHHTSGWVDWNMALDLEGGPTWAKNFVDSPVIVNATAGEYYKQPSFYAMGHFAKFLEPNSVRIHHELEFSNKDDKENVFVTVFQRPDDLTRVATVLNKNEKPLTMELHDTETGNSLQVQIEASSLESFIWHINK